MAQNYVHASREQTTERSQPMQGLWPLCALRIRLQYYDCAALCSDAKRELSTGVKFTGLFRHLKIESVRKFRIAGVRVQCERSCPGRCRIRKCVLCDRPPKVLSRHQREFAVG